MEVAHTEHMNTIITCPVLLQQISIELSMAIHRYCRMSMENDRARGGKN